MSYYQTITIPQEVPPDLLDRLAHLAAGTQLEDGIFGVLRAWRDKEPFAVVTLDEWLDIGEVAGVFGFGRPEVFVQNPDLLEGVKTKPGKFWRDDVLEAARRHRERRRAVLDEMFAESNWMGGEP